MSDLEKLRFNYEKNVNNLSNQGGYSNKFKSQSHKMKHTRSNYVQLYQDFYAKESKFSLDVANFNVEQSVYDLEMYLSWLGNNGKRD